MSDQQCREFRRALGRRGPKAVSGGELAAHRRLCASCAEALGVAGWLHRAASEEPPRAGLPSASQLWWRARIIRELVERESRVARVTRASRWSQGAALALIGLLVAAALTGLTSGLFGGLAGQVSGDAVPWGWLAGLLLAGTAVPLAGFGALWLLWRES